jgi:type II secretion system protein J
MRRRTVNNGGFTLAEVLVASTISAFIAAVAVGALKTVVDSAQAIDAATETAAELRFAARMIARDLNNLYRDVNPQNMRLLGASQGSETGGPAFLVFYVAGRAKARMDQPESDVYEVEYFVGQHDTLELAERVQESVLFRRLWPNPHEERNPGGILTPIAENIGMLQMRFFDGEQWAGEWPEEMESIPQLIEITLVALPEGRKAPVIETFMASFPRLMGQATVPDTGERQPSSEPQAQPGPAEGDTNQAESEVPGARRR